MALPEAMTVRSEAGLLLNPEGEGDAWQAFDFPLKRD